MTTIEELKARRENITTLVQKSRQKLQPSTSGECRFCHREMKTREIAGHKLEYCVCEEYKAAQKQNFELSKELADVNSEIDFIEKRDAARQLMMHELRETIGARFSGKTFEDYEPTGKADVVQYMMRYADRFPDVLPCVVLYGGYGTGKTHLASATANAIQGRGCNVAFFYSGELLAKIRDTYRENAEYSESDVFRLATESDLLVLDDLGRDKKTEWSTNMLFQVIDKVYREKHGLIITTNLSRDGIENYLGGAAYSRLLEIGAFIRVTGGDFRKKKGAAHE